MAPSAFAHPFPDVDVRAFRGEFQVPQFQLADLTDPEIATGRQPEHGQIGQRGSVPP